MKNTKIKKNIFTWLLGPALLVVEENGVRSFSSPDRRVSRLTPNSQNMPSRILSISISDLRSHDPHPPPGRARGDGGTHHDTAGGALQLPRETNSRWGLFLQKTLYIFFFFNYQNQKNSERAFLRSSCSWKKPAMRLDMNLLINQQSQDLL